MLGQNNKESYRIRFELVVDQINVSCADISKTSDINHICLQLNFTGSSGKEEIRTECISNSKRTHLTQLDYALTWKHHPVLKFYVTLSKRKGLYEKSKRPPELLLLRVYESGDARKLGSAKLELYEQGNRKNTGQTYEENDKISINLRNNKKLLSCELLVKYRISDTDPSVVEADSESKVSSAITPSVSIETINSLDRAFSHISLKKPIYKMLDEIHLIGVDGNLYSSEWSKMHLIFFVFGTMPDFMTNLKDLIQMLQEDRTIGLYVEVVHICQGDLAAADVLWPYLPHNDYKNPTFHDIFAIQKPYSDHPKIYVVNEKMTEYFVVEAYQIEKYLEEKNVLDLYYLWNHKKPPADNGPPRSISLQEDILSRKVKCPLVLKSNSLANLHNRSSSYDGSSLPLSSSRSSLKNHWSSTNEDEMSSEEVDSPCAIPPIPDRLTIPAYNLAGEPRNSQAQVDMCNILVEDIHSRLIDFMKDLLTAGNFNLTTIDKQEIADKTLLIITTVETCLDSNSLKTGSTDITMHVNEIHQNSGDSEESLKAPPKPPRSFSRDRIRKISKLYEAERATNSNADFMMYSTLIKKINAQLLDILNYLQRAGEDLDSLSVDDKYTMIDTVLSIMKRVETCETVWSKETETIYYDEELLETPTCESFFTPANDNGNRTFMQDPLEIGTIINYTGYVDEMVDCYDQFQCESGEENSEYFEDDDVLYDTIADGAQSQSVSKTNADNFNINTYDHDKNSATNSKCSEDKCEYIYSTVNKSDNNSDTKQNFDFVDNCIDVKSDTDGDYAKAMDVKDSTAVEDSTRAVNSLVIEQLVIEQLVIEETSHVYTNMLEAPVIAKQCVSSDNSGYNGDLSHHSSTVSLGTAPVKDKIKWFSTIAGSLKRKESYEKKKQTSMHWSQKRQDKLLKPSSSLKEHGSTYGIESLTGSLMNTGSVKSMGSINSQKDWTSNTSSNQSPVVFKRITSTRKLHDNTDKKEKKQLKIRLKTMSKNLDDMKKREEDALEETEEWKARFEDMYTQILSDSAQEPAVKVTETLEYKALEARLTETTISLKQLQKNLSSIHVELEDKQKQNQQLISELEKLKFMEEESHKVLEKVQQENIFFRHQVLMRGELSLRSGTFNLFKSRWFQLETLSSHSISPVISFYNGPDKLGQIILADIVNYEAVTDTQFRLSTPFATYVINSETREDARRWLSGIENLQHTFAPVFNSHENGNWQMVR